jgi:hypothetical protein
MSTSIPEAVTLTLPRSAVPDAIALSRHLLDRMHDLLEQNTEGTLSEERREELESLVELAQFGQFIASALESLPPAPRAVP